MTYSFTNDKPIYAQLLDTFIIAIVSGELPSGSKLDSVRDLALSAQVNPNTMQKAMVELERLELVRTERASGRYITDNIERINQMKKELAQKEIETFMTKMKSLGLDKTEIIKLLDSAENEKGE